MPFPDFIGIGAQRSGTSWLAKNLAQHPAVWMPPLKELHYFDQRIKEPSFGAPLARFLAKNEHPDDWYPWVWRYQLKWRSQAHRKRFEPQNALWDLRFFARSPSDRWYASLFEQGRGKITGEITPEYSILEEKVVAHIHELMPHAKIMFFMRNPIERVYSAAIWRLHLLIERNIVRGQQVEAATDEQLFEGFEHPEVRSQTNYLHIVEKWRRFYPDDHIFIGFFDDIQFYPTRLLRRLYRFLGVDVSFAQKRLRGKVNSRSPQKMPTRVAAYLARAYYEDLQRLSARFGGHTSFWLYCAQRLAHDTLDEDTIPYPLWGSKLWEEWIKQFRAFTGPGAQDGAIQSRSLAQFRNIV